ncbi:BirA family transcriptional regulator, biotin operon repressor / biotin-[acetyl-CoA-carboxylase] ligase [Propionispira arboris]|uniref:Bifunctional ligase/repressor BirA n=1 Tax=Propionispira arboris TaxID=84035 RepID=A0A1H7CTY7_9FIRM|nr:biotin--[acetyl-CoA-carboxylase] ligase [Propionispira arboris]SEJ92664.1 BirA family transcriptional regulator, biotin operon repressor / biotin-[acetyl-CoA-carboxylase] ligase [Propionispira arboris]
MRSNILDILRQANGTYVSGEDIARTMNVSRTAVWKHIRELKQAGYAIDSHSRSGYCLMETPDLLLPSEIQNGRKTKVLGKDIQYYKEVISTNNQAKFAAQQDAGEGTIIVSEAQTSGRGRLARGWYSPAEKGIWFSVILRPHFLPQEAPKCTLLAAVAIVKAIETITEIQVGIKWPNDILYNKLKLVGILTEMNAEMDCINYIIIGMGINVNIQKNEFPLELQHIATSLAIIKGKKISRVQLLNEILFQIETLYNIAQAEGFVKILEEWKKYSVTLGKTVDVIGINDTFAGLAMDIDADGALLVKTKAGIKRVLAGDVSIRAKG